MEADGTITKPETSMTQRLLPAVLLVIFIAMTYVDPRKWVASIEGGARFGNGLVILMFVFSLATVLYQYLSASIVVITGRDLAQICTVKYDTITCILLGLQAELSMIALDLSMIFGTAHALNLTFGFSLFTLALFSYFFGVLTSQRDTSLSVGGSITNFSGESAFALMSLHGASIMPYNFFLHSSIVQQNQGSTQVSKRALCHVHLFAIACVFSGFLINFILMNSAANVFYSTGLDLLTFQDTLSLMDQSRSPNRKHKRNSTGTSTEIKTGFRIGNGPRSFVEKLSEFDFNLPDEILDYEKVSQLTTIEENSSDLVSPGIISESVVTPVETVMKTKVDDSVEKTL
ncbi:ethylene-insensitive protein 2-like protein [Tanacetum coccineum]